MKFIEKRLFNAQALDDDFESDALDLTNITKLSVQLNVDTADSTGQFQVAVSNDKVNWTNLSLSIAALAGAPVNIFTQAADLAWKWAKVTFVAAGGTSGTVDGYAFAKE